MSKVASAVLAALLFFSQAHAHHSFSATYMEKEEVVLEGELVAFMFRNPHAFVHLMAPDANGEMQRWAVEWGAASALQGEVDRDTLKPGDHVVVVGNPGRTAADHRVRLVQITRPADGWQWGGKFE
jgi:hypothetical protein